MSLHLVFLLKSSTTRFTWNVLFGLEDRIWLSKSGETLFIWLRWKNCWRNLFFHIWLPTTTWGETLLGRSLTGEKPYWGEALLGRNLTGEKPYWGETLLGRNFGNIFFSLFSPNYCISMIFGFPKKCKNLSGSSGRFRFFFQILVWTGTGLDCCYGPAVMFRLPVVP